ncbi:hypothetical protein NMY22_g15455 [Coprinellus aureogranulatus]|nr:hypothetical protein NMY22_g15455 [Coprinellus aureogranulatus]
MAIGIQYWAIEGNPRPEHRDPGRVEGKSKGPTELGQQGGRRKGLTCVQPCYLTVPNPRQIHVISDTHVRVVGSATLHDIPFLRRTLAKGASTFTTILRRFEGEEVHSSALARTGSHARSSFCCSVLGEWTGSVGESKSENATWASRVQGSAAQETLKPGSPEIVRRKDLWRNGWLLGLLHFARAIRVTLMGSGLGAAAASSNMGTAQVELEGNKTALRNLGYHSTLSKSPANKKKPLIYLETLHPRNGCEVLAEDIVRRLPERTISVIYQKRVHESPAEFQPETTGISQRSLNPKSK